MDPLPDDFWQERELDLLASEQRIQPVQDLAPLRAFAADLWETDEEFDRFVASLQPARSEASAA